MRSIPGMVIINPADDIEAMQAVKAAAAHEGPVYMRFGRLAVPVVFDESFARLDNGRLKNMLSVAQNYAQNNSQSIILTSHAREADVMREVGGKFKHIYM